LNSQQLTDLARIKWLYEKVIEERAVLAAEIHKVAPAIKRLESIGTTQQLDTAVNQIIASGVSMNQVAFNIGKTSPVTILKYKEDITDDRVHNDLEAVKDFIEYLNKLVDRF
jgi:predicted metalloendopeptidase